MLVRVALIVVCLLFAATAAEADQCTVSTTSVNFGSYNVYDTAHKDSTGTITLRCNGGASNVKVEIGRGGSPWIANRFMNQGLELLFYNLYQNASRTTIWGDDSASDYHVGNPPNNKDVTLTVYGRITAGQDVSAGSYSDSVTVTVQY
jgi:spore coat protein U-like protein